MGSNEHRSAVCTVERPYRHITTYSWLAALIILGEGIILLLFNGLCPLTVLARKYSGSPQANFDIFLPEWLAKYNKLLFGSIFVIGLTLMVIRYVLQLW
jgi:hypothetical protein